MLADVDELSVRKQASFGVCHVIFDNMDLYVKTLHQLTLPLLMFETHPTKHLLKTDSLSIEKTSELFDFDTLNLDCSKNTVEKNHFLMVVYTVLARTVCSQIKGRLHLKKKIKKFINKLLASHVFFIEPSPKGTGMDQRTFC